MTSSQFGELIIIMSLAMTLLSGTAFLVTVTGKKNLFNLGVRAYKVQIALVLTVSFYLFYLIFSHDFSIQYVYSYSSTDLPFFYLLSSFWAGQEGTYLVWFLLSTIFGLLIIRRGGRYKGWGMVFYTLVNIFLSVMLLVVSPFKSMSILVVEGAGLNPLLQDFWMVIHPPVMFCAYAMAGVPFALVMAAVVKRDYSDWLSISLPWVLMTSLLLLVGNAMGAYWSYKTLGWGGFWAWDPVENSSFVPWVVSLALFHGLLIEKRSSALRRCNLLMTAFVFLLVIYGTFLTRSGVLADFSVHSFVDLGANAILIGFMIFYLLVILGLFIIRYSPAMVGKPLNYNIYSREFILFIGMALMFIFGIIVLFWSSLPLITTYLSSTPTAANVATYNSFAFPFAILMSVVLVFAPLLTGSGKEVKEIRPWIIISLAVSLIISILLYAFGIIDFLLAAVCLICMFAVLIYSYDKELRKKIVVALLYGFIGIIITVLLGVKSVPYIIFIGSASAAAGAGINSLIKLIPKNPVSIAGPVGHFSFGIMIIGILVSSVFSTSERIVIPRDFKKTAFEYDIVYKGTTGPVIEPNSEILLELINGNKSIEARPQFFFVQKQNSYMKRPYIKKNLLSDLYLAPLDIQKIPGSEGLILLKGESETIEDYNIRFIDFKMIGKGAEASSDVTVEAELEIEHEGVKEIIRPFIVSTSTGFKRKLISLFTGSEYNISLENVLPEQGAVVLNIPGLIEPGPPDQLILEISDKPGINLLWVGIIIMTFGMGLAFYRRMKERI